MLTIRASSLNDIADCPRRWAARNIKSDIIQAGYTLNSPPKSIAALVGTAVHAGAAGLLKAKMGEQLPCDFRDLALDAFKEGLGEELLMDDSTPDTNTAEAQVKRMVNVFAAQILPTVQPIMIERHLEAMITEEVKLSGHGDYLCASGVRDLKTGKVARAHRPQVGAYAALYRTHGYPAEKAFVDFIPRVSIKKPQPDATTIEYDIAVCEAAATATIKEAIRCATTFAETKDPWAFIANPSSMLCSGKWCPAYETDFCKEHK